MQELTLGEKIEAASARLKKVQREIANAQSYLPQAEAEYNALMAQRQQELFGKQQ